MEQIHNHMAAASEGEVAEVQLPAAGLKLRMRMEMKTAPGTRSQL